MIVGAGSAGAVVAHRLVKDAGAKAPCPSLCHNICTACRRLSSIGAFLADCLIVSLIMMQLHLVVIVQPCKAKPKPSQAKAKPKPSHEDKLSCS